MRVTGLARLHEERGATLVIVALSLVAIFGMVVLTVDVGGLLAKRRGMVNAADAAALAAAQSYALEEAECGTADAPAMAQADTFANDNVAGTSRTGYSVDCDEQTVQVSYTVQQGLFFAPILGFGESTAVASTATAIWGSPTGGNPMPIELDPTTTNQCVYENGDPNGNFNQPQDCPKGYWFNNQDLTNSGWGLMNLNTWGIDFDAVCSDEGGSNALNGWILQTDPITVTLKNPGPTYVCTMDGSKTPNWLDALISWAGTDRVFLFPENDPNQMNYTQGRQKYAIVAFAPMKVKAVYKGNDPAAFGSTGVCDAKYTFTSGATTVDLANQTTWTAVMSGNCGAPIPRSVDPTGLQVWDPSTGKKYQPNKDYNYDSNTHVLTWKGSVPTTPEISFSFKSGGPCAGHQSDPNAYCLWLKWAGKQLIGIDPVPEEGPGQAVQLIR